MTSIANPAEPQASPRQLRVEADFLHDPPDVTLRIYEQIGNHASLLRLQELYNIAHKVRRGQTAGWKDDDIDFCRHLWPEISKPYRLKENLQVLKLPQEKFQRLLERWRDTPQRLIDRATGKPCLSDYPAADLQILVENRGRVTRLKAMVVIGESAPVPLRDCGAPYGAADERLIVNDTVCRLQGPMAPAMLRKIFGADRDPEIPTEKVVAHLPALLQGELHRLHGDSVHHVHHTATPIMEIRADGGDLLLACSIAGEALDLRAAASDSVTRLHRNGDEFEVIHWNQADFAALLTPFRTLALETAPSGFLRLRGTSSGLSALRQIVAAFNDRIQIRIAPDLASVFAEPPPLQAVAQAQGGCGWLEVQITWEQGDHLIPEDELERACRDNHEYLRTKGGRWIRLDVDGARQLLTAIPQVERESGRLRVPSTAGAALVRQLEALSALRVDRTARQLFATISAVAEPGPPPIPPALRGRLRSYQTAGVAFLHRCACYELGCLLADDMGLGKTVQLLTHLATDRVAAPDAKSLIVCPASVLSVWMDECRSFTPELRLQVLTGGREKRERIIADSSSWDILVVGYSMVRVDNDLLRGIAFRTLVLDEAQQIKNAESLTCLAVKTLVARHRIALTGTPLENRLLDLWSIVDVLNPGFLGSAQEFKERYTLTAAGRSRLTARIAPLFLRRKKEEVLAELPPRTIETIYVPLSRTQSQLYTSEMVAVKDPAVRGNAIQILATLTRLRQICCHPALVTGMASPPVGAERDGSADEDHLSPKLECLLERLDELTAAGHSALVFSQFTRMLSIIEARLQEAGSKWYTITGATPVTKRPAIARAFQNDPEPSVFLLSLKAAGTGLTLTRADYVFLFDPWWNPAAELQAIDRVHRIGQENPVFAYRLVAAQSVEENVARMQEEKRQLFTEVVDGAEGRATTMPAAELMALLEMEASS